ncbi:MAG: hypothetical protein KC475_06035 [Cyanobacteria bacterium HKST-UBA03]|nr:hypothetical protein [Cyanobacteria bacterium HKST-UBA03]
MRVTAVGESPVQARRLGADFTGIHRKGVGAPGVSVGFGTAGPVGNQPLSFEITGPDGTDKPVFYQGRMARPLDFDMYRAFFLAGLMSPVYQSASNTIVLEDRTDRFGVACKLLSMNYPAQPGRSARTDEYWYMGNLAESQRFLEAAKAEPHQAGESPYMCYIKRRCDEGALLRIPHGNNRYVLVPLDSNIAYIYGFWVPDGADLGQNNRLKRGIVRHDGLPPGVYEADIPTFMAEGLYRTVRMANAFDLLVRLQPPEPEPTDLLTTGADWAADADPFDMGWHTGEGDDDDDE